MQWLQSSHVNSFAIAEVRRISEQWELELAVPTPTLYTPIPARAQFSAVMDVSVRICGGR